MIQLATDPGPSAWHELILYAMGSATLTAGFLALVWRIVRPHVAAWVRGLIAPVATHQAHAAQAAEQAQVAATAADTKLDQLVTGVERLNQRVRVIDGRSLTNQGNVAHLRKVIAAHVRESNEVLNVLRRDHPELRSRFTEPHPHGRPHHDD